MKKGVIISISVIALIIIGIFYYTSLNDEENDGVFVEVSDNQEIIEDVPVGKSHIIDIQNFSFNPSVLNISKGDKVIWINLDSVQHTVTSDSGSRLESELLENGESYSYVFNQGGSYSYHCIPHPMMKGKIVVN